MKPKVIVNPAANKGSCGQRWPEIQQHLAAHFGAIPACDVALTNGPDHATAIAREAIGQGYRRLVAIGGDGTTSEVLNGVMDGDRLMAEDLVLAQVPAGTANELSRVLGHAPIETACRAAASAKTRAIDVFRAEAQGIEARVTRYGFLLAIVGAPATISYRAAAVPLLKRLGPAAYLAMTAITAVTYSPKRIRISVDDGPEVERRMWGIMLCSFEGAGEGLILAPGADPSDALLDLIELGDLGRIETLTRVLPRLHDGSYIEHPKVGRRLARSVRISSDRHVRADVDGESIGTLPMTVRLTETRVPIAVV